MGNLGVDTQATGLVFQAEPPTHERQARPAACVARDA
jgi:hypothetical protein